MTPTTPFTLNTVGITLAGRSLQEQCHGNALASGWHHDLCSGERKVHNKGERLMLIVSEIAEAMEGARKNQMDDHLPHLTMLECELADAAIRIFDSAGDWGFDLGATIAEKLTYNSKRADHKPAARRGENGKQF